MNRDNPKAPNLDSSQRDVTGEQQVEFAELDDAVTPPGVQPVGTQTPSGPLSEDDQVEAGFDNMPV